MADPVQGLLDTSVLIDHDLIDLRCFAGAGGDQEFARTDTQGRPVEHDCDIRPTHRHAVEGRAASIDGARLRRSLECSALPHMEGPLTHDSCRQGQ